jgi:hypothetical protein
VRRRMLLTGVSEDYDGAERNAGSRRPGQPRRRLVVAAACERDRGVMLVTVGLG